MPRNNRRIPLIVFLSLGLLASPGFIAADDDGGGKYNWLQKLNPPSDDSDNSQGMPVTGVRGLEETSGKIDTKARDYVAVDLMEKVRISETELGQFLKEGGLQ